MELFESALFWIVSACLVVSLILLILVKDDDTPRWLDVFAGLMLIGTSALFLGLLSSLQEVATASSDGTRDFKILLSQYQVAVLILPFVSAAIGTNLISHAITYNRNYDSPKSINEEIEKFIYIAIRVIAALSIFGLFFWAICGYASKRSRANA